MGNITIFFLDFIHLSEEINNANVLSTKIRESLEHYGINVDDILSCTTDNCSLMCLTAECLDLWRIPCVLHIINLIFKEFISGITKKISPIFELIQYLSNSEKYENFIYRKSRLGIKIQKVPSYIESRWTSFCDCILVLFNTKNYIGEFLETNKFLSDIQLGYLKKLVKICEKFREIILTYEKDDFGASGCFLADISIIKQMLSKLENTDLKDGVSNALIKIEELKKTHRFFWDNIAPMALILNPSIEDIEQLLTNEQIEDAKRIIQTRMKKYPAYSQKQQKQQSISRFSQFQKKSHEDEEAPLTPIQKLIENRNIDGNLFEFWQKKIGTEEQQLALVALEILGILVTSALTERYFSKSRYVINNLELMSLQNMLKTK